MLTVHNLTAQLSVPREALVRDIVPGKTATRVNTCSQRLIDGQSSIIRAEYNDRNFFNTVRCRAALPKQ